MKKIFEEGFSLSEALIFLLITCLVMIATMPLITIRHIKLPERAPHGKWACKLINGQMYSATAANVNAKLPPDEKWKKGCTFPELPSSVSYVIVQAIGGGASGRQGDMTIGSKAKPWIFSLLMKTNLFILLKKQENTEFTSPENPENEDILHLLILMLCSTGSNTCLVHLILLCPTVLCRLLRLIMT